MWMTPVYLSYGAEFVRHPLDPYAFRFGSPYIMPANNTLVPPVLPYWLGTGTLLFGDHPALLKFWLLPLGLALAWAVDSLAARVAPSLRVPLIWLCVLSPTTLPGFNFMLDVPALALGLTVLAIAMRSVEQNSWGLTLLAGLVAALAIQTKYTGITSSWPSWCGAHSRGSRNAAWSRLLLPSHSWWVGSVCWRGLKGGRIFWCKFG